MPAPVAVARGLNLHLKSGGQPLHILKDVSLELSPGEVTAVVGPSGSGKTSLLMVLSGLEQATAGSVSIDGVEITGMNEDKLAIFRRKSLGILFQNFHLIPSLTALETLRSPSRSPTRACRGGPCATAPRRRSPMSASTSAAGTCRAPCRAGRQQRVGLARAMVGGPKMLLADEPTGNLDQETGAHVIELMFRLARERDTSVLLITHDPGLAKKADRQLRMNEGHLSVAADA